MDFYLVSVPISQKTKIFGNFPLILLDIRTRSDQSRDHCQYLALCVHQDHTDVKPLAFISGLEASFDVSSIDHMTSRVSCRMSQEKRRISPK